MHTINRERFTKISAEMWGCWVTKKTLVAAARRVGVLQVGLNVNNMQQDKFGQSVLCQQYYRLVKKQMKWYVTKTCLLKTQLNIVRSSNERKS